MRIHFGLLPFLIFSPEAVASDCKDFCEGHDSDWEDKCSWQGCNQCSACHEEFTFLIEDVTSKAIDPVFNQWGFVGKPGNWYGSPAMVDMNGDGVLDFFDAGHWNQMDSWFMNAMNCTLDEQGYYCQNNTASCLEFEQATRERFNDMHGAVFADLDGDGYLDLHISTGGDMGVGGLGRTRDNILFWGGDSTPMFVGGIDTAMAAGLAHSSGRGRYVYVADIDRDGLLDVHHVVDRRGDNLNVHGQLLFNNGNRTFSEPQLREYARSAMLTDANGDGFADEFVVFRTHCFPQIEYSPADVSEEIHKFCEARPAGSTAVYKFINGSMELISPVLKKTYEEERNNNQCVLGDWVGSGGCSVESNDSGDLDNDGITDHAVLYNNRIEFFLSTDRMNPNEILLIGGSPSKVIDGDKLMVVRIVDLDLDGKPEILVMNTQFHVTVYEVEVTVDGAFVDIHESLSKFSQDALSLGGFSASSILKVDPADIADACGRIERDELLPGNTLQDVCAETRGKALGFTLADFNNDGLMDWIVGGKGVQSRLLQRRWSEAFPARFLRVQLLGQSVGNRDGVGATVVLTAEKLGDFGNETRTQLFEFYSSNRQCDRYGHGDKRIVFGLGKRGIPTAIAVHWPDTHKTQEVRLTSVNMDDYIGDMSNPFVVVQPTTEKEEEVAGDEKEDTSNEGGQVVNRGHLDLP